MKWTASCRDGVAGALHRRDATPINAQPPSSRGASNRTLRDPERRERAEELIDLATTEYGRTGEKGYRVHACIARAQVRLELGDGAHAEAERWLLEGLEAASATDNLQQELIISTHLARLAPRTGKLREAHDRLAGVYARLTEGLDRGPAREAKAALDELAAWLEAGNPPA
jgi:ATP/maltotriose-dependent transcriptional regulator MalT